MPNENPGGGDGGGNGDGGNNAPAPNGNNDGNKAPNANGDGTGNGDGNGGEQGGKSTELTKEQLEQAFQHPRFKELTQQAAEAKKLKEEKEAADKKALEEQGKHKELAEKAEAEASEWKSKYEGSIRSNAIIVEAGKLGALDASTVVKLVDSSKITINDDGSTEGAEEAVKELQTSHPYLFGKGSTTQIGGGDASGSGNGEYEYKASDFKNHKFYMDNQEKMDKAMNEGKVDMTR